MAYDREKAGRYLDTVYGPAGQTELRQSMIEGMQANPDTAAKALPYADKLAIPLDMAERKLPDLEAEARFDNIDFNALQTKNPLLADFLRDKDNARLAHDDIGALTAIGDFGRSVGAGVIGGVGSIFSGAGRGAQRLASYPAERMMVSDNPLDNFLVGTALGTTMFGGEALEFSGEAWKSVAEWMRPPEERRGMADNIAEGLGQAGTQITAAVMSAPATLPIMIAQGLDYGFDSAEKSGAYGTPKGDAAALLYAGATGLTEKYGLEYLMKGIPEPIKRGVLGWAMKAAERAGMSGEGMAADAIVKTADTLFRGGTEAAQEFAEGFLQNLVDVGVLDQDKPLLEGLDEQAAAGGGVGVILGALFNTMLKGKTSFQIEKENIVHSEMKQARELLKSSNLFTRARGKVNEYLNAEMGGKDLYLNPDAVQTFYQSMDEEGRAALNAQIPDFEQRLGEAITSNGDMVINRADYMTYIQPWDSGTLDEYVRMVPEDMSVGDRREYDEMMTDMLKIAEEDNAKDGGDITQENIYSQLRQMIGQRGAPSGKADIAKIISQNPRKFYETVAARTGNDPRALEVLNRLVRDVTVQRVNPRVAGIAKRSDFDLLIDKARTRSKGRRVAEERKAKNLFGEKRSKKEKIFPGPKPLVDYLIRRGQIRTGSSAAKSLEPLDLTPKKYPNLFARDGRIENFDEIPASEINAKLSDVYFIQENGSERADEVNMIDWVVETIRDEQLGTGGKTTEDLNLEAAEDQLQELISTVGYLGLDIESASNQQIKDALSQYEEDQRMAFEDGADVFNQDASIARKLRSALVDAVANLKQAKGSGEQMLGILKNTPGVKEEEIVWTGLDEFLKGKKSVTKDDISQYLNDNQVQIEEVTLNDEVFPETKAKRKRYDDLLLKELSSNDAVLTDAESAELRQLSKELDKADKPANPTKFSQYTLPGGKNYRELLLTLPDKQDENRQKYNAMFLNLKEEVSTRLKKEVRNLYDARDQGILTADEKVKLDEVDRVANQKFPDAYGSSHYDQKNILAHVRLNDRVDADGKRVLFVEEIQSDWHQAGRKKGYSDARSKKLEARRRELEKLGGEARNRGEEIDQSLKDEWVNIMNELQPERPRVPDAPFKKNWQEMAFRRVAQMAAQGNYDRIAWTTGEQQNARYDLSKEVSRIEYKKSAAEDLWTVTVIGKDQVSIVTKSNWITLSKIEDLIGKDMAQKIANNEGDPGNPERDNYDRVIKGDGLKVGGDGMKGFYDNILVKYANKFGKKFGAKVADTKINIAGNERLEDADPDLVSDEELASLGESLKESPTVHSMDITPEMRASANRGFELFQDGGKDPRGSISFLRDGRAVISLFESENLSTMMHELGHLYWKALHEIASLDNAPEQIVRDAAAMRAWVGAADGADLTVEQEEKIADGFLAYLREGEAPSAELQGAFSRMRSWMTRIYRGVRDTLPRITPEIKSVFDRMLATDDEISSLSMKPEFNVDAAIMALLPKAQAQRYQRKMEAAIEVAKAKLLKKAIAEAERRYTDEYREALAQVRKETEARVKSEQVYQTIDAIIRGGGLDRTMLLKDFGQEVFKYLTAHGAGMVAKKGGMPPHLVASAQGYSSSRAMIGAIMNAQKIRERMAVATEESMLIQYGDMLRDGRIEEEAMQAYHNSVRGEVLAMEAKMLADLAGIAAPTREAIKAKAQQIISQSKVSDINASRRLRAENSAYFKYGKALGQKQFAKAARFKAQQLLNHDLYRMSLAADEKINKKLEAWRRLSKRPDERVAKSIDIDYVYAAQAILSKFGIGTERSDFVQWIKNITEENPDLAETLQMAIAMNTENIPAWNFRSNKRGVVTRTPPFKSMEYGDFQALGDAIDNLLEVGRGQRNVTVEGKKVEVALAIEQLSEKIRVRKPADISTGYGGKLTDADKRSLGLYGLKALTRRIDHWVRDMDGGYTGAFHDFIWNRVTDGTGAYRDQRNAELKRFTENMAPHADDLHGEPIIAEELISDKTGERYVFENKGELLGMLHHIGNESNLTKLIIGMGWGRFDEDTGDLDTSALDQFRTRMEQQGILTKEDYALIQRNWDQMESMKPAVWKAHKEMYGFRPDEVTAVPFRTSFGEMKGGYWPAVVDRTKNADAQLRADRDIASNQNNMTAFPTTGRGATKSRVETYAAPLEFSLRLLPSHVDWACRFIHIEPAIKDVMKILMNKEFRETMGNFDPAVISEMLVPWLQRVGRQAADIQKPGKGWKALNNTADWMRRQTGLQTMIMNVPNIMQQLTGFFPLAFKVGGERRLGRAFIQYMQNPQAMTEKIHGLSSVMRHAHLMYDEDYAKHVGRILEKRTKLTKVRDFQEDYGYVGQRLTQNMVNHVGWLAAFNQALEGKAKSVPAEDQALAVRYADQVVAQTQGFAGPENVSNIEAQTAMGRLFLIFYSYFNNQGNFLVTEAKAIARSDASVQAKAASAFYLYLMCYAAPSFVADIIGAGMRGALPDDDDDDGTALDEWFQFYAISQFRYASAMAPYAGQVGNFVIGKFTDAPFDDQISASPAFSVAERIVNAPFSVYSAVFGDGDASKAVKDSLTAVGAAGIPVGFVQRPLTYAADVAEGDSKPTGILSVGRGILAGPAAGGGNSGGK